MPSTCPFETLSISPNSTEKQVLHAWRRLMRIHHPDKAEDSPRARELNAAKDACVLKICTDSQLNLEEEFVKHINTVLQEKSGLDFDMSNIIRPQLHSFMHIRAVDAMKWVILCAIGERPFQQKKHDEIPILRKYYDAFVDEWDDDAHTIMTVLNKYEDFIEKGSGNFVHCIDAGDYV